MNGHPLILHVEDDPNDVMLLQRACRKAPVDLRFISAADGDQAVDYLSGKAAYSNRAEHPLPDMVLLDLKMPRRSGLEVLEWIRQQDQFKRLVVAVFTSSRHDQDIRRAYALGANSYLVKPVGFDQLVSLVRLLHLYWFGLNEPPSLP